VAGAGGVLVGRGYVSIRPEFEGDWSRSVNARASSAGRSGAGAFSKAFSVGLKGIGALAGVAVAANLSTAAASAAALAPALATAGAAAGALKLGLTGVGEAFKQAFADNSADVKAAASATKAVESAQRGLANAQRALAQARVDAARRVADAQRQVVDAERDLADAQRDARQVQDELNDARREAARALEDMNQRLAESHLDEREAVLRLKEAEQELKAAQQKPGVTPAELERLRIAYERARLNLTEQRTETARLAADTKKANKAGVEGSEQVVQAKERIADANRNVADKERALADAQRGVDEARADGARQIADAQRAVADAAAAVADAQAAAAAQTSKLDTAMAKLAPNARSFVNAVRGLAPAWTDMRMAVQNSLFQGLDDTVTKLGQTTIPILKRQLTGTAGVWNQIAKNAASGVQEMAKSGMLDKILSGATKNLAVFKDTPKQLITAFGQLTVAAQPAFNRLLTGFAGAIKSFTDGIAKSFESGGLQEAIDTAFGILQSFGTLLGNVFGVVSQIFKAASDAGGQIVGTLGTVFGEIKKILAGPEMQAQLRQLFGSVAQIVGAIVPVIGAIVQAVVPLAAALAKPIAELAVVLGPVLQQLVSTLGAALMPLIKSLAPVLVTVGTAIVELVQSVMPLLQPIADLIAGVIMALAPALTPILSVFLQLVGVLVGPLTQIVRTLTPVLIQVGGIIARVFQALEPFLAPLVALIGQVAQLIANVFAAALQQLMRIVQPLIPVGMRLLNTVFAALMPILPALGDAINVIASAFESMGGPLSEVGAELAQKLLPIVGKLMPVIGDLAGLLADTLAQALPMLADAFMELVAAIAPVLPDLADLTGMVVALAAGLIVQLLPSLVELIKASVQLLVALLPILPPLAELIGLVVRLAVGLLNKLLPPLLGLAKFLIGGLASAISKAIGWVAGIITVIAKWTTAVTKSIGPALTWLRSTVSSVWGGIQSILKTGYDRGIKPVFDTVKKAVGLVASSFDTARKNIKTYWDKLEGIARKPVQFIVDVVYNKGIVGVWNAIAGAFGAPKLKTFKFASGGVLPGYTPGRDPHRFYSPSGMALEMSGGEAIMRPEFTRGVGSGFVSYFNQLAKSRGAAGVRAALAPVLGGNPPTPTDHSLRYADGGITQRFADGGIFGWIKSAGSAALGAGSAAWNKIKESAKWLKDTLEASARAGVKNVVDPLLRNFPGASTGFGKMLRNVPTRMLDALFGYGKKADDQGGGGIGGPKIQAALRWAKTQNGLPYQWGGNGNPSWDCSGFMSAIESVLRGQKPHRRWSTHAFNGKTAPPGWVYHGNSPFRIGITAAGVGHTAGTLGKTKVESRGGDGVVVGPRARGYNDRLFTSWYGFQPGKYDAGGFLQPGFTLAYNGTGRPEPVLTGAQFNSLTRTGEAPVTVEIHTRDAALAEFIDVRVHRAGQELAAVINAS
jgi:phage-related protein/cell wall-associated NlpC family hydrolase